MYVGRLCLVGVSKTGAVVAAYLLSSRTFPERMIDIEATTAKVIAKGSSAKDYPSKIFYDCIKVVKIDESAVLVVGNGPHTDYVESMVPRDSDLERPISDILEVLGHERDEQKTPRIIGVAGENELVLAVASERGLDIKKFQAQPGKAYYVSTYQLQEVGKHTVEDFTVTNALEMIKTFKETEPFRGFTNYIGSATANFSHGKLDLACD